MATACYTSPLAQELAPGLLDRFTRYVQIDTQSRRDRTRSPSTPGQLELGRLLVAELAEAGLADASLDQNGYVIATLAATNGADAVVGLIAHLDTSPDAPGAGVAPIVHRDYDGGVLELPRDGTRLDPASTPEHIAKRGHDIVTAPAPLPTSHHPPASFSLNFFTASGDTLHDADDRAGVAEIMAAVTYLAAH